MREFFYGWRRNVGCVTLVMACVMAGAWMASLQFPWSQRIDHADRAYWFKFRDGMFQALQFRPEQLERPVSMMIDDDAERRIIITFSAWAQTLTVLSAYLILWQPRKKPKPGSVTNA